MDESRKPSFLSYLFFVLVLITLLVASAEFILKSYFKIPADFIAKIIVSNPDLSPPKRVRPNLNGFYIGAFREYRFHVSSNSAGFRRTAPFELNDSSKPAYITLGDSQTFGIGMDDDATIASFLSTKLNKTVLNAGCSGYNNIEEYLLSRELTKLYQPEYFILLFYPGNDPYENFSNRFLLGGVKENTDTSKENGGQFSIARIKEVLLKHSAIYSLLTGIRQIPSINKQLYKMGLVNSSKPNELVVYESSPTEKYNAYWQVTEEALLKVQQTVEASGSRLLIVMVPDKVQINTHYWRLWKQKYNIADADTDMLAPNDHLRGFAAKHKMEFLDPTPAFQKHFEQGEKLYWKLDHHLRAEGNRVIAESLADYLSQTRQAAS